MPTITPSNRDKANTITVKTQTTSGILKQGYKWWNAGSKKELAEQLLTTAVFLKENQKRRYRNAGTFALLYGNMPLFSAFGTPANKMSSPANLPIDRPTMNVIQSCIDTLVSRLTQSRPRPMFLTDGGDSKQRKLGKQMNHFIPGELYQTKAYELAPLALRDACVLGTGCLKIYENSDKRVALDRVLEPELLVDPNDAIYGTPRTLYQFKLVDRDVLASDFPQYRSDISRAEQAYFDSSGESSQTVSDQVMVIEGWRLPSSKTSGDGLHAIACSSGVIFSESWEKENFPFAFLQSSPRMMGFWGQGTCERLMGTQVEINKLLMTISSAINLVGVPRVFVEDGSKIVKAHLNNSIGSIVTYRGTKPIYEVAPCMPAEVYAQLQRLVEYAYQQEGVSAMGAASQKPQGLDSGEAIRSFDNLMSDRFAALGKRYDNLFTDLSYQITDKACEIAKRDGKYQTVYPDRKGTQYIDLPATDLLDDPYVIQCFEASSLPRDPAGRLQKVTEMAQAGMITMPEARRLLDYPDLEQDEQLASAAEERILQQLDSIVEDGKFEGPDPFTDLLKAEDLTTKYINLYGSKKLSEERSQLLRDYFSQVEALNTEASSALQPPPGTPMPLPQAVAEAPPTSPLLPNAPQ